MKYSIIIPIYNVENYIYKCLASVYNQSFKGWECICVNDGSSDSSSSIVEDFILIYGYRSSIYVINQFNGGVSVARNVALSLFRGDWIQFLDSDDSLDMDFLSSIENYMTKFPYVDGYEHTAVYCYQDGKRIIGDCGRIPDEQVVDTDDILSDPYGIKFTNLGRCMCYKTIRSKVIDTFNLRFYEGIPLSEDMLFAMQYYTKAQSIAICPKVFGYLRIFRNDSAINTINYEKLITREKVAEAIYHTYARNVTVGTCRKAVAAIYDMAFLGKNISKEMRTKCIDFLVDNSFFNSTGIPLIIRNGMSIKARFFALFYYYSPRLIRKMLLRYL